MESSREQRDAARLVRRGKGHRHEIQQRGDAKHDLHIGHREQGRGRAEGGRGQRRAHGGAPARREEQRCREVRCRR